jgi:hypothetical protein
MLDGLMVADQSMEIDGRVLRYCLHGPADGFPVIAHNGTPSTRFRRPDQIAAMHECGVRVLMPDRPGTPNEQTLRPKLEQISRDIMEKVAAGGPEMPGMPPAPPARDDPDAMARLRATFLDSYDGWVDDRIALAKPWGFTMPNGEVTVSIWYGTHDENVPAQHAQWLLAHIPGAQGHQYDGGHVPGPGTFREIFDWLRAPGQGDQEVGGDHKLFPTAQTQTETCAESGIGPVWRSESFYA